MARQTITDVGAFTSGSRDKINANFTEVYAGLGGLRIVAGTTALDGTNPTTVSTGLSSVTAFVATLVRSTGLNSGTAFVTHAAPSGGSVDCYGWVVAGTASSGTESFDWIAVGT